MNDYDLDEQAEISKPPLPRARDSLRKHNVSTEKVAYRLNNSDNTLKMNRMQENIKFLDHANEYDDYTDDEDDESNADDSFKNFSRGFTPDCSFASACNSPMAAQVRERSLKSLDRSQSFNKTNSSYSQNHVHKHPKKSILSFNKVFIFSIITITILYVVSAILPVGETTQEKNVSEINEINTIHLMALDKQLDESMKIIRTKFHNQKFNIWNDIASGIYDVVAYPQKPTIIILFGDEVDTLNCLAQMVANLSSTIVGSNDYFVLTPTDFPNDVGRTINTLRAKIAKKQVVVIQDLLNINAQAMRAFHNFCDRQNPLIKKAVYILTMVVDGYKPFQNELAFVDKQISKQLSGKIDKDVLDPLVTRLTDGVIVPVVPESTTTLDRNVCRYELLNKRLVF